MADKPILFSAPMVRAILAGTKTQTRRPLRTGTWWTAEHGVIRMAPAGLACTGFARVDCPYGQPNDRLWVREAWKAHTTFDHLPPRDIPQSHVWYMADDGYKAESRFRRGMFMPRWASRILLNVLSVRVERLQDISAADALAEGIVMLGDDDGFGLPDGSHFHYTDPRISYWSLWDAINGAGSVEANPWVWVVEFRRSGADGREG